MKIYYVIFFVYNTKELHKSTNSRLKGVPLARGFGGGGKSPYLRGRQEPLFYLRGGGKTPYLRGEQEPLFEGGGARDPI